MKINVRNERYIFTAAILWVFLVFITASMMGCAANNSAEEKKQPISLGVNIENENDIPTSAMQKEEAEEKEEGTSTENNEDKKNLNPENVEKIEPEKENNTEAPNKEATTAAADNETYSTKETVKEDNITEVEAPQEPKPALPEFTLTDAEAVKYVVNTSSLNVRTGAAKEYQSIGLLNKGVELKITGVCSNGWYRINFKDSIGFVSGTYLSDEKPPAIPEVAKEEPSKPISKQPSLVDRISNTETAKITDQIVAVIDKHLYLLNKGADNKWTIVKDFDSWYGAKGLSYNTKRGDLTTPMGSYELLYAFGTGSNPGTILDYRQITENSWWSNANDSPYYNRWYEGNDPAHYGTGEYLLDYKKQYKYSMVIGYNMEQNIEKTNAIFLHVDGGRNQTAGCVSVSESNMLYLMRTVKKGAYIIITDKAENLSLY